MSANKGTGKGFKWNEENGKTVTVIRREPPDCYVCRAFAPMVGGLDDDADEGTVFVGIRWQDASVEFHRLDIVRDEEGHRNAEGVPLFHFFCAPTTEAEIVRELHEAGVLWKTMMASTSDQAIKPQ